jgi:hypothetical protein
MSTNLSWGILRSQRDILYFQLRASHGGYARYTPRSAYKGTDIYIYDNQIEEKQVNVISSRVEARILITLAALN